MLCFEDEKKKIKNVRTYLIMKSYKLMTLNMLRNRGKKYIYRCD